MSKSERKIGFYNFVFEKITEQSGPYFDKDLFLNLWNYINSLPQPQKVIRNDSTNKAMSIDTYDVKKDQENTIIKIVFKSCKYNHVTDLMSSIDGTERPSNKQLFEGDKEKTHLCMRMANEEAEAILEERRNGVTINEITHYLNKRLKEYLKHNSIKPTFRINSGIVPSENFETNLKKLNRVKMAEIFTNKKIIGSEFLKLYDSEDPAMKKEIVLTLKSKHSESLFKRNLHSIYQKVVGQDAIVSRIRIYGNDEDNKPVKLDSDIIKKIDYINTQLDSNGIVNSSIMFKNMESILGVED